MNTEEKKGETCETKFTDFTSDFRGCEDMFEKMDKCCPGQDASPDCSAMRKQMMKSMMGVCCGAKMESRNSGA